MIEPLGKRVYIAEVKVVYATFFSWTVTAASRAALRVLFAVRIASRNVFSIAIFDLL